MSSSSWSTKLETRLSALADTASKESLQTLAKWMGFNRKHRTALASALATAVKNSEPTRQWLYLQLAHEVFILDIDDPKKWDRLADLRTVIGETAVIPAVSALRGNDRVADLVEQWDNRNVFGGPTLLIQIRKTMTSTSQPSTAEAEAVQGEQAEKQEKKQIKAEPVAQNATVPQAEGPTPAEPTSVATEGTTEEKQFIQVKKEESKTEEETPTKPKEPEQPSTSEMDNVSANSPVPAKAQQVKFDFDKEGIPYGKVDAREFQDPCKAIATLQIARELRSDTALQLSSAVFTIPAEVVEICLAAKKEQDASGESPQLSKEVIEDISTKLSDEVLDLDLEEMLQNIETFQEIVQKQRAARERLIHLLIQSRCQFGSNEAAESFYSLDDTAKLLQKRKELLLDAMALEGLDFEESTNKSVKSDSVKELEPLSWYEASEPDAKRVKKE